MAVWVVRVATGDVVDYSEDDGLEFQWDAPGYVAFVVPPGAKAATRLLTDYRYDGTAVRLLTDAEQSTRIGASFDTTTLAKAIGYVLVDEINALRQQLAAQAAAVAAATTLADLKTRWAGLPATPDRTPAQARTAVVAKVKTLLGL